MNYHSQIGKKTLVSIQTNKDSSSVIIIIIIIIIITIIMVIIRELEALITTLIEKLEKQMKNFYQHILAVISLCGIKKRNMLQR